MIVYFEERILLILLMASLELKIYFLANALFTIDKKSITGLETQ